MIRLTQGAMAKLVAAEVESRRAARTRVERPAQVRIFGAAGATRLTSGWATAQWRPQDEAREHGALLARARDLFRDHALVRRYCELHAVHVAGPNGFTFQARILDDAGELARQVNPAIEDAWKRWAECVTLDERESWAEFCQALEREEARDGEQFIRLHRGAPNPFLFALERIDPARIDPSLFQEPTPQNPLRARIWAGVELDERGRAIAYHVLDEQGIRGARKHERIPASVMIHKYTALRPMQVRGIPPLHAGMTAAYNMGEYEQAVLVAARAQAAMVDGVKQVQGDPADVGEAPVLPSEIEPGQRLEVPYGYEYFRENATMPPTGHAEFMKVNARHLAVAGNVSYMTLTGDLSETSYSSGRIGVEDERDTWRSKQVRALKACTRIYREWLPLAAVNQLTLRSPDVTRYWRIEWQPRRWGFIDPAKDLDAIERELALRLTSRRRVAAERGRDFETVLEEWDQDTQLAAEYDVALPEPGARPAATPVQEEASNDRTARSLRVVG